MNQTEKLPRMSFCNKNDFLFIVLKRESGTRFIINNSMLQDIPPGSTLDQAVAYLNKKHNVTPAQASAMRFGSMWGWDLPLADPDMYDEDGKFIAERLNKKT